tara:strand:- start:29 stop:436 length:408 start_codon:yes stop_codon:yes gene_type:complete
VRLDEKGLNGRQLGGLSRMVESVEISRVNIRDTLSLDISVWMNHPDDMDFRPSLSCKDKTFTISSITTGEALASIELDDEQMQALEASMTAELRVKFQVHGMHGRLNKIAPIIADGKAKKLATANWKTTQTVTIE